MFSMIDKADIIAADADDLARTIHSVVDSVQAAWPSIERHIGAFGVGNADNQVGGSDIGGVHSGD